MFLGQLSGILIYWMYFLNGKEFSGLHNVDMKSIKQAKAEKVLEKEKLQKDKLLYHRATRSMNHLQDLPEIENDKKKK